MHGKQKLPCVLMQVKGKDQLDVLHPDGSGTRLQGASSTVLCQLLGYEHWQLADRACVCTDI